MLSPIFYITSSHMSQSYGVPRRRFLPGLGEWRHSPGTCSGIGDGLRGRTPARFTCAVLQFALPDDLTTSGTHNCVAGMVITDPIRVNRYTWISIFSPDRETSPSTSVYFRLLPSFSGEHLGGWNGSHHSPLVVLPPLTSKWPHDLGPILVESGVYFIFVKTCRICLADTLWNDCQLSPASFATEASLFNFTFASFGVTNVPIHSSSQAFSPKPISLSFAANCFAGSIIYIRRARSTVTSKPPTSSSPPLAKSNSPISVLPPSCPRRSATLLSVRRSGWRPRSSAKPGMASRQICGPSVSPPSRWRRANLRSQNTTQCACSFSSLRPDRPY